MVGTYNNGKESSNSNNQQLLDSFKAIMEESLGTKFYTRCFVQGKVCSLQIDKRNCNNVVSEYMVKKLGLKVKQHPWLDEDYKLRVSRQVMISIAIGKYEDEVLCDVLPMESCHILLGKPWQNKHQAIQDVLKNRYSFKYKGGKIRLISLTPNEIRQDQLILKQRIKQAVSESLNPPHQKEKVIVTDSKETPTSLINIAPELPSPSESSSLLQDSKDTIDDPRDLPPTHEEEPQEESPADTQGSLSLVGDLEQPTHLVHKQVLISFPCDYPRKQCKEIDLVRTKPNLFMMISTQEEKRFGLENVKELCVSKSVFDKGVPTLETLMHDKLFKPKSFLSKEFCELDTLFKLNQVLENVFYGSNSVSKLCKPTLTDHFADSCLSKFTKIITFSSIMHLSLPKENDAGSKEKLEELLVEEVLIKPKTHADSTTKPPAKQPVIFDPGTLIETFPHEQGKEIIVADTIIPRYASLLNPNAKWLEFEHISKLYNSNDDIKNVFPFCEKFKHKKFFRHGGFLFDKDKLCEPSVSLLKFVLLSIDKFTRTANTSNFDELFFGEVVYYDSILNFNKNLGNPAEHGNYVLDDLSKKLLASRLDYAYCTYDRLSRGFVVSPQDVSDGELIFHAPKTWLFHVWLKKNVVQTDLKPLEYFGEKHGNVKASSIMFKEEPPDPTPIALIISDKHIQGLNQISTSLNLFVSHVLGTMILSLVHPENIEKKLGLFKEYLGSNFCLMKEEHEKDIVMIQIETCSYISMTVIIHLLFVKGVENIAGKKEESPELEDPSTIVFVRTGIGVILVQNKKKIAHFRMIFEVGEKELRKKRSPTKRGAKLIAEPFNPARRINNKAYELELQGKYQVSSSFNVADLVPYFAEETDLRSNPSQLGEDDVSMASKEPELKEQLVPDHEEANGEAKEPHEPEETSGEDLHVPLGPMTRSKAARFQQAINQLLHTISGQLECACPTTLVVIQAT